jgi:putative membrane protein
VQNVKLPELKDGVPDFSPTKLDNPVLMQFRRQIHAIARLEAGFVLGQAKIAWSMLAVALIPALYSVIYLSSLWDPASHSQALNVGIVNLDQGLVYRDSAVNVGQDLSQSLQTGGKFNYQVMFTADEVRQHVRQGKLAFALIIPENFSANAVPGEQAGAGQLVVFASQGNNIETARIAQQFASELGHKINERLNAQRWSLVLLNAAGSKQSVSRLNQGLKELHHGATELSEGSNKAAQGAKSIQTGAQHLSENVSHLSQNAKKLGAGLRQIEANRPRNSDLRRLDAGAETLVNGVSELGQGLQRLHSGSRSVNAQVSSFKADAENSLLVTTAVRDNVLQLSQGLQQLDQGLLTAANSGQKLEEGAQSLRTGVTALTTGVRSMTSVLRSATTQLPEDAQFEALDSGAAELANSTANLAQGTEKIREASQRLEMGLALVEKAIPDMNDTPDGSPEGLADSVRPLFEMDATVQNNGIGFIANVIPAALWLGAGIAVFFVNLRVLPRHAEPFHPVAQWLGKMLMPATLVLIQSVALLFIILVVLEVNVVHPLALTLTIVSAGLAFLCLISALTCFLGDAGKAMAMVLLALQMTSSGGVMPVELSGSFFATLSPWLPITWLAHGLKAALFGAFESTWFLPWLQVTGVGVFAAVLTIALGRWRFVSIRQSRPRLDL